jgi:hypothetical protein
MTSTLIGRDAEGAGLGSPCPSDPAALGQERDLDCEVQPRPFGRLRASRLTRLIVRLGADWKVGTAVFTPHCEMGAALKTEHRLQRILRSAPGTPHAGPPAVRSMKLPKGVRRR